MAHEIFGAIRLGKRVYEDQQIAELVDHDITGWTFAGDQRPEESNIYICEDGDVGQTFDTLPEALAFLAAH